MNSKVKPSVADILRRCGVQHPKRLVDLWDEDMFVWDDGDKVVESSCNLENPESCESCQ